MIYQSPSTAAARPEQPHWRSNLALLGARLGHRLAKVRLGPLHLVWVGFLLLALTPTSVEAHTYSLKIYNDTGTNNNMVIRKAQTGFGNSPVAWDCMMGGPFNCTDSRTRAIPPRSSWSFSSSNVFSEDFKMRFEVKCDGSYRTITSPLFSKNDKSRMVIVQPCGDAYWGDQEATDSGWLDRDDPGSAGNGNHDWEKLHQHRDAGNIPDLYDTIEPAFVQMRLKSTQQDVFATGDAVSIGTDYGGKVTNYSGNPAAGDYEILFRYGWTPWLDEDRDNTGDEDEGLGNIAGIDAPSRNPTYGECRLAFDHSEIISTNSNSSGVFNLQWGLGGEWLKIRLDTERGCVCYDDEQSGSNTCNTRLQARYYYGYEEVCDGNYSDGTDNGRCDASAGQAKLVAKWNGSYCLDVSGVNSTSNNTNVQLWSCSGAGERWRFNLETGRIHAAWDTSMCLDVAGTNATSNGTNVGIYDCDHVTEKWTYDDSTGHIRAQWNSNVCLDISGVDATSNGKNAQIWSCSGVSETWNIVYE